MTEAASAERSRSRPSTWLLHPFLVALFPVAFLYRRNIKQVPWPDVLRVALVVFVVTLVALLVALLVFRNAYRAAVATTGLAIVALSYGHVRSALDKTMLFGHAIGRDAVLLPIWAVLAVLAIFIATRVKRSGPEITKVLNGGTLVLFLLTAVPAAITGAGQAGSGAIPSGGVIDVKTLAKTTAASSKLRDILYIVPDDYVGFAMKPAIGFDNEPFLSSLEKRGFYVARRARTNYFSSYLSLTSTLNMEYLPDLKAQRAVNPLIEDNKVVKFLRDKGYRWVYLPGWYDQTAMRDHDDITYQYKTGSAFSRTFTDTTIAGAITRHVPGLNTYDLRRIQRETSLFQLRNLPRTRNIKGPKFIMAHIILPHPPFVFAADGRVKSEEEEKKHSHDANYAEQVQYMNAQLSRILKTFLSGPVDKRPIVLLQTEEGINPLHNPDDEATEKAFVHAPLPELDRSFSILSAYYLPGFDANKVLRPNLSPVNSFRTILNLYFDTKLPMLPDKHFLWLYPQGKKSGLHFVDITDRFKSSP